MATYKHNKADVGKWLSPDPLIGGKKKKGEEEVDTAQVEKQRLKHETLKAKAEEKGWSERKKMRRGVEDPTADLPENWKAVWKKGEYVGAEEKKMRPGKSTKTPKEKEYETTTEYKSPQGKINIFYSLGRHKALGGAFTRLGARLTGKGPKSEYWKTTTKTDWTKKSGTESVRSVEKDPSIVQANIHAALPTKTRKKRK